MGQAKPTNRTIGLDVSRDTLDARRPRTGKAASFPRSLSGLRALRRRIGPEMPDLVVLEATCPCHAVVERSLARVLSLVKAYPLRERRFGPAIPKTRSKARLAQIKRHLIKVERAQPDLARQCPKQARTGGTLCPVPGLGRLTAVAILIECAKIGTVVGRQIAGPADRVPTIRQSGHGSGKAFIQGGRRCLRDALCMPAPVAA